MANKQQNYQSESHRSGNYRSSEDDDNRSARDYGREYGQYGENNDEGRGQFGRQRENEESGSTGRNAGYGNFGQGDYGQSGRGGSGGQERYGQSGYGQGSSGQGSYGQPNYSYGQPNYGQDFGSSGTSNYGRSNYGSGRPSASRNIPAAAAATGRRAAA